jgi:2-polyprenyl-6-methoxyphenol hydroxylase-like FAD-dependent oxidoreductase
MATVVVIGSSIAGLLSACGILNKNEKRIKQLIILERDAEIPSDLGALSLHGRKGTPQTDHGHILLEGGRLAIEEIVPGFTDRLLKNGAVAVDRTDKVQWFRNGAWKLKYKNGKAFCFCSRMMIDRTLRQLVLARFGAKIQIRWGARVTNFVYSPSGGRIEGVELEADKEIIKAELVIDAMGRTSQTEKWICEQGYRSPKTRSINMDLAYATNFYKCSKEVSSQIADGVFYYPDCKNKRGMGCIRMSKENVPGGLQDDPEDADYFLITFFGYQEHKPKADSNEDMKTFVKHLELPQILELIEKAKPLYEVPSFFHCPNQVWKRYSMSSFPKGLVVVGDSLCALDPTFAQGMTSAARQAKVLQNYARGAFRGKTKSAQKAVMDVCWLPFMLNSVDVNKFDGTTGYEPPFAGVGRWFVEKAFRAANTDATVFSTLLEVASLETYPTILARPDIMCRVLIH